MRLLSFCACVLAALAAFTAQADVKLTYQEKYGDHMGTSSACQAKNYYFYNAQGEVVRHVFHTAGTSGQFEVQNVYYYNFDENGNLSSVVNYQWRPAYSEWTLSDSIAYEYDANGNCIVETGGSDTYTYTYDANGNMTKKVATVTETGQVLQTIIYSDFVDGVVNKPRKYESDGAYSNYLYSGTLEYDAAYRVIVDDRLTSTGSKMQRLEYVYDDNNVCVSEKWYTSPSWTPEMIEAGSEADTLFFSRDLTRTLVDNKYYQVKERAKEVVDFDPNDFSPIYAWTTVSSGSCEYYVAIDETTAPSALTLQNVSTEAQPNSVKITAQAAAANIPGLQYIIWRNWEMVATVEAVDGVIEYVDSNVASAHHTYFVQAYDAVNGTYYNVSDLVSINMQVDLAPVTNIKMVAGRKEAVNDVMTGASYDTYIITLEWDAPVCDYDVISYEIYQKPFAMPIATVTGDVLTAELSMPDCETADIRIDAIYELGTAMGQYVTFKWDPSKDFEGEQPLDVLTLVKTDNGGELILELYDAENKHYRGKTLMATTTGYEPNYQYYYNYENGLLAEYYFIQYKEMGVWTDPKDHVIYTYDEQGRLVKKENIYTYNEMYEYQYDEQGRLISYTRYGKTDRNNPDAAYDKPYSTVTYSDFDENGNPKRMDYTDHLYATSSYFVFFTYDAKGNVLVEEAWTPLHGSDDENAREANYKYENTYDEYGIKVECVKYNGDWETGEFVYATRETRTKVSDTQYDYVIYNYNESDKNWAKYRTHTEYYAVLDGAYAPRNLKVDYIDNANFTNAVQLTCSVPEKEVPNAQYIVWYDWQPVDTLSAVNGKITYIAENLENGRDIEFLIQSYDAVNDIMYNVSNAVVANYTVELPSETNLHYVKTTVGEFADAQGYMHPAYWVHFAWDAPATDLEIECYNVYEQGWAVPLSTTTNTCDSLSVYREKDFNSPDQQKEITVEVLVKYTTGESEKVSQTFQIENASLEDVVVKTAYINGDKLYVQAPADVEVYNVSGVVVVSNNDVNEVDLASLASGVYVAAVKVGDKLQIIKFVR